MKLLRRAVAFVLLAGVSAVVVVVDRHSGKESVGASTAIVEFAGFPQASDGTRISTSWFCPGAAAGDGISSASIVVVNPSDTDITATLNFSVIHRLMRKQSPWLHVRGKKLMCCEDEQLVSLSRSLK